jgi:hypothetical protein
MALCVNLTPRGGARFAVGERGLVPKILEPGTPRPDVSQIPSRECRGRDVSCGSFAPFWLWVDVRFAPRTTERRTFKKWSTRARNALMRCNKAPLFDHLVGGSDQSLRDLDAKRRCCL